VCLARNASNITGVIGGTLENYFMNPTAWNLKGYTGFVWGGCAWIVFVWAYFRLPETKVSRDDVHVLIYKMTNILDRAVPSTNSTSSSPRKCQLASSPLPMSICSTNMRRINLLFDTQLQDNHPDDHLSSHLSQMPSLHTVELRMLLHNDEEVLQVARWVHPDVQVSLQLSRST
jgi:hypothetical protein